MHTCLAIKSDSVSFSLSVGVNDALSDLNAAAYLSARHCSTIYCLFSVALLDLRSILLTAETVGFLTRKIPVAADDAVQAADGAPRSLARYSRTRLS